MKQIGKCNYVSHDSATKTAEFATAADEPCCGKEAAVGGEIVRVCPEHLVALADIAEPEELSPSARKLLEAARAARAGGERVAAAMADKGKEEEDWGQVYALLQTSVREGYDPDEVETDLMALVYDRGFRIKYPGGDCLDATVKEGITQERIVEEVERLLKLRSRSSGSQRVRARMRAGARRPWMLSQGRVKDGGRGERWA